MMNKFIQQLLQRIGAGNEVFPVPVSVEPYASIDNCFINVAEKVKLDGGSICYGWKIGHQVEFLYEAEWHAVWLSPNNERLDITPQIPIVSVISFVEDSRFTYQGNFIDNIRINATDNDVVDDFIILNETISTLWQFGKRGSQGELRMLDGVVKAINSLESMRNNCQVFIESGNRREAKCFCGSNQIYGNCHGKDIKLNMQVIIERAKEYINANPLAVG
jgi:hypothetical protein